MESFLINLLPIVSLFLNIIQYQILIYFNIEKLNNIINNLLSKI